MEDLVNLLMFCFQVPMNRLLPGNLQVLMFWKFAEPALNLTPRMIGAVMYCILFSVLLFLGKYLPADFVPFLGMIPTAIGTSSRLPQIYMNFKQQHTGNLSFITWFLSLGRVVCCWRGPWRGPQC